MKPDKVFRLVSGLLLLVAIGSAAIKTKQEPSLRKELISAVRDSITKDSLSKDTVFVESGFTIDPRKSDSARVQYLATIGYFDSLRLDECTVVLVPKTINKLIKARIDRDIDSLITYQSLKNLTE